MQQYYTTLGLKPGATLEQIIEAYQRLASKYHPDKHPEKDRAEYGKKMAAINVAYEALHAFKTQERIEQTGDARSAAQAFSDFENKVKAGRGVQTSEQPSEPKKSRAKVKNDHWPFPHAYGRGFEDPPKDPIELP